MSKHSPLGQEAVMQEYLDSLLHEPVVSETVAQTTARLLEQAQWPDAEEPVIAPVSEVATPAAFEEEPVVATPVTPVVEALNQPQDDAEGEPVAASVQALKGQLDETFQALFFDVAGLTLAVPLITLGGIHQLEKVGPLIGKPAWFKGVMLHREQKINVVDTARWVMPEKYDQTMADNLNYQYLIMLGNSLWGLACDKLVNTVTLTKDDIKWRESQGKRPWLAGMVKQRMCALVDVNQLISMLNKGLGSQD